LKFTFKIIGFDKKFIESLFIPREHPWDMEPTKKKQPQTHLAYTPNGMNLGAHTGWGTLLFTSSRACDLSCDGCWTEATPETIRKQLKSGAEWLYDGTFGIDVLESILKTFSDKQGKLVACMSDGEPLVPANYPFTRALARASARVKG